MPTPTHRVGFVPATVSSHEPPRMPPAERLRHAPSAPMAGVRVLVTGASGFIGSRLAGTLVAGGAIVHAVSRRERAQGSDGVAWHLGDLASPETAGRLLDAAEPQVVIHLASAVTGRRELPLVLETFAANLSSTVHLLAAATERRVGRVVLAGSLEEPDPGDREAPGSPYAASKWAASGYARLFHALYSTPVVNARLFMVYGPAQRDLLKLIPYVTLSLLRGRVAELSSGERPVDWVHVVDVVSGLLLCATRPGLEGRSVELGSGELVTVREVAERLHRIAGGPMPHFGAIADRPLERVRAARLAESEARLGWRPRIGLDEGLAETVRWYRAHLAELDD